ncbi:hypothetical protein RDI58_012875 [Solanum bulbocastanum]|uniref:Uncharacterized protein n=1 Tax=Solanum bulbocastanum TaxID=147425 RepID=A0AAN8TP47_SOLBU
MRGKKVCCG